MYRYHLRKSGPCAVLFGPFGRVVMSDENVAIVCNWFAAGDAGRLEEFDRYLHRDVVVHAPLNFSTSGIEAEREIWRSVLRGVPDILHSVQQATSSGSNVAIRAVVSGTHQGE